MDSNIGKDLRWAGAKTAGGGTALIVANSSIAASTGIAATIISGTGIVLATGGTALLVGATGYGLYKFFTK